MNSFFIKGFKKIAEPELSKQVSTGASWDKATEHRYKRQAISSFYEGEAKALRKKNRVTNEEPHINPNNVRYEHGPL